MKNKSSILKLIINHFVIASIFLSSSTGWLKMPVAFADSESSEVLNLYQIPRELMIELSVSEKGLAFYAQIDGMLKKAIYNGLFDINTLKECFDLSDSCIPNVTFLLPTEELKLQEGEYQLVDPKSQQSHTGQLKNESTGDTKNGESQLFAEFKGVFSNVGNSALQAGLTTGLISILGGKDLKQAEVLLDQSNQNLRQVQEQYLSTLKQTKIVGHSYQQAVTAAEFLKAQKINIRLTSTTNSIDLDQLQLATAPFDQKYQTQVAGIAVKLNKLPPLSDSYAQQLKSLSTDLLYSSIETRLQADFELSDAQLNVAQEVADFLVGIDPYSGLLRGVYEAYTGENMVTGQPLDDFQRTLSGALGALNLVTLGLASTAYTGYRVIAHIYKSKFATNYSAYLTKVKNTFDLVELFKLKKVLRPKDLKKLDGFFRKGVSKNEISNIEDVSKAIDKAAQARFITPIKFSSKFNEQPFSDESLEFIYNGVEVGYVKAQRIFPGNTDEIYIIGRRMGDPSRGINGVIQYKEALVKAGFSADKVKIFHSEEILQLNRKLFDKAELLKRHLSLDELKKEEIWKLNEQFIDAAIGAGQKKPTIIDLQRISDEPISHFYDTLEIGRLNESGRKLWNPRQN